MQADIANVIRTPHAALEKLTFETNIHLVRVRHAPVRSKRRQVTYLTGQSQRISNVIRIGNGLTSHNRLKLLLQVGNQRPCWTDSALVTDTVKSTPLTEVTTGSE